MGLTGRKARPLNRKISHVKDTRLIIIATEGTETEKQYFEIFKKRRVQVVIIPTPDNRSAPDHVLSRLDRYAEDYDIGGEDELWLMVDTDRWGEKNSPSCLEKP